MVEWLYSNFHELKKKKTIINCTSLSLFGIFSDPQNLKYTSTPHW